MESDNNQDLNCVKDKYSEYDLIDQMIQSVNKHDKQFNLFFELGKSYKNKPSHMNKIENTILSLNFYRLISDKAHYIIKDLILYLNISKIQMRMSILLTKMILKLKSDNESETEPLFNDLKYTLNKSVESQMKIKYKLLEFKTNIYTKFEMKKNIYNVVPQDRIDKFSKYISELDLNRKACIDETEDQIFSINNAKTVVDSIMKDYNFNTDKINKSEGKDSSEIRKIIDSYKSDTYKTESVIFGGVDFYILKKLAQSSMNEIFNEIGIRLTSSSEDNDGLYGESVFFDEIKNEIKLKISETKEYKSAEILVKEAFASLDSLDENDKKATDIKNKLTKSVSQIKYKLQKMISKELIQLYNEMFLQTKSFMRVNSNDMYAVIKSIREHAYRIEKLFSIFDTFPDQKAKSLVDYDSSPEHKICSVCLENVKTDDSSKFFRLRCGHIYHTSCHDIYYTKCCNNSTNDLKPKGFDYRDEFKSTEETYYYIISKQEFDDSSAKMLTIEFNSILSGLNSIKLDIESRYDKITSIKPNLSSKFTHFKLDLNFILKTFYSLEAESLISPINDVKRLIYITFELSRLNGLELNHNYI